jgi:uncharacterized protein YqgC (DUF456 family)
MLLILSYIIAAIGLLISIVGLPGIWLVVIAVVLSGFALGFDVIPIWLISVYFVVALLASFLDNLAVAVGASRFGASKWGMVGAVLGGIFGFLIGNFIGVILGPFIGAVLFELLFTNKDVDSAVRAGIGTFLGYMLAILLKFVIAVIMVGSWLSIILK